MSSNDDVSLSSENGSSYKRVSFIVNIFYAVRGDTCGFFIRVLRGAGAKVDHLLAALSNLDMRIMGRFVTRLDVPKWTHRNDPA